MKKAFRIIKTIFVWLVVLLAVGMMVFTVVSVNTFDRADRSLFGYKAFIVLSDSMRATDFAAGDLVLVKETDPASLQPGDIISYRSQNAESYGEVVTHKIRSRTTDETGAPGFVTYGTTTNQDDEGVVTYDLILGKYEARLPGAGKFFQFLKTTPGYLVCIFLPFLLLILVQGFNSIRLFKRYKQEQLAELQAQKTEEAESLAAQRAQLEAERLQSQQLLAELQQLKAALARTDAPNAAPENPAPAPEKPAERCKHAKRAYILSLENLEKEDKTQ